VNRQDEVSRLLADKEISADLYLQYTLCANLKLLWPTLSGQQRAAHIKGLARILPRAASAQDPEGLVQRILDLSEEDMYAALRFSFETSEYMVLPGEEIYPTTGWLGQYIAYARAGNAPLAFHAWAGLLVLGACCQRRVFYPGAKHVFMNMYVVLGALRAGGKGQAFDPAIKLLNLINKMLSPNTTTAQQNIDMLVNVLPPDSTQEAMVTNLAKKIRGGIEDNEDGGVHITTDADAARVDATGVIGLDEMATFFGKDAWAVAKKAPWLSTIKDTDRYEKETKNSGVEILNNTAICMLACCAPDWMHNTIKADLFGGGFMDRCTWVYRDPAFDRRESQSIVSAPPKDPLMAEILAEWIINNILSQPLKVPVLMTPEAEHRYNDFHRELVMEERAAFEEFGSDAEGTSSNRAGWSTVQIASLLALSEGDFPPVTVQLHHLQHAIQLVMAEEDSMVRFMGEANRRTDAKVEIKIVRFIIDNGGCAKLSDITKNFTRERSAKSTKEYISALIDQDRIEDYRPTGRAMGGRTPVVYRVKGHACERCGSKE